MHLSPLVALLVSMLGHSRPGDFTLVFHFTCLSGGLSAFVSPLVPLVPLLVSLVALLVQPRKFMVG